MNEFDAYELLCQMQDIAKQYKGGLTYSNAIRELALRVRSQLYRVAVIGEFKRGKSSLINALIGSEILPTDVLPMTAVITRLVYGEQRKITVDYKNGCSEEYSVGQLVDFATKYDSEKEARARQIREITVYYPSVFCKNHIELIDTPGMNDNEEMAAATLSVLKDIDAAVMVISACSPLSITEQKLIIRMIGEPGIRHIIFAVTYIDLVSDESDEQDQIIGYIQERIRTALMQRTMDEYADKEEVQRKAERILSHPDVFGVSSLLAMRGFIYDDNEALRLSRFPTFKRELFALLISAQSTDVKLNAVDVVATVGRNIDSWYQSDHDELTKDIQQLPDCRERYVHFFESASAELVKALQLMNENLAEARKFDGYSSRLSGTFIAVKKIFVRNLCLLREQTYTDSNIRGALQQAMQESIPILNQFLSELKNQIDWRLRQVYTVYAKARPVYADSQAEAVIPLLLTLKFAIWKKTAVFPPFRWVRSPIPPYKELTGVDVIKYLHGSMCTSLEAVNAEIEKYIASGRAVFLRHNAALMKDRSILDGIDRRLSQRRTQKAAMEYDLQKHLARLKEAGRNIRREENVLC